jgi:hypothetical protein
MVNSKISALTSATTPLAGTEVLPIVQSSTTKQVSVANLTAGRTQTSNGIVQGTAATGYNFTANTPAAGMTSQLLNWYEEGTFTTTWTSLTGTPSNTTIYYIRVGQLVFFTYPAGANVITGTANSTRFSLPFTPAKPAVGAMITDAVGSAGNTLIWTGTVVYPATFSASGLIFSGTYHV